MHHAILIIRLVVLAAACVVVYGCLQRGDDRDVCKTPARYDAHCWGQP